MSEITKIAILGYGHIGKKHAELVSQNPAFDLVVIIDCDESKSAAIPDEVSFFPSLEHFFFADIPVDLIAICTPNGFHFEQARAAIQRGIHVVIEKPITLNSEQAELLQKLARE